MEKNLALKIIASPAKDRERRADDRFPGPKATWTRSDEPRHRSRRVDLDEVAGIARYEDKFFVARHAQFEESGR
jgi:hypothetical protein